MANRLNNQLRDQIVTSVMSATNFAAQRAELLAEARAVARATIAKQLPAGWDKVVAAAAALDPTWLEHCTQIYAGWDTHVFTKLENRGYIDFEALPVPHLFASKVSSKAICEVLQPLTDRAVKLVDQEDQVRAELRAYLRAHRTVESAVKNMPELEAHVPKGASSGCALVVSTSNLLSSLMAAGFAVAPGV